MHQYSFLVFASIKEIPSSSPFLNIHTRLFLHLNNAHMPNSRLLIKKFYNPYNHHIKEKHLLVLIRRKSSTATSIRNSLHNKKARKIYINQYIYKNYGKM
jgi:hypothetical protein